MNRLLTTIAAGTMLCSAAFAADDVTIIPFHVGESAYLNAMSDNGRWATYQLTAGTELTLPIEVFDLTTGKAVTYVPAKLIGYNGKEEAYPDGSYSVVTNISNDGKTIVGSVNGQPGYFTVDDLTWHKLSMGNVMINRNYVGSVYDRSADGKKMVGWFTNGSSMTEFRPGVWVEEKLTNPTKLPTYEEMMEKGILSQYQYNEDQLKGKTPNFSFRELSDDGNIMLFGIDHNLPGWGCSYCVYDFTTDTYSYILPGAGAPAGFTDSAKLSNNGKWVTGTYIATGEDDKNCPFRYEVATGKMELFDNSTDVQVLPTAIDNDGTIYGGTPGSLPTRRVVVRNNEGIWVDLMKVLDQKYGIDYNKATGFDLTGYVTGVSDDCRTAVCQASMRDEAFVITMPVKFAETLNGVSLLNDYAVSPTEGMKFAKMSNMYIRFSYAAVPTGNGNAQLLDAEGDKVAEAKAMTSTSSQNLLYVIAFDDVEMDEDKEYTVFIPAGTFKVDGTDMVNNDIRVKYVGRADTPVAPVTVAPEDDSYLMELGSKSPIRITFDADLTYTTAVNAELWYADGMSALTTMIASVDGKKLTLYPATDRKLNNNKDYVVKIPAGLVSDMGGFGANEAFEITYHGTYVPMENGQGNYKFFDDINDPGASLGKWLLYDGDHNNPTDEMKQNFEFDADNTPWNFSIRETTSSSDFCAMSHSIYSPKGQSDDWMSTPRINIPNDKYFLSFKGQAAYPGKNDILKVYVWENDEALASLDKKTVDQMKADGKVIAEIPIVYPGTELLADGWKNYEFPLADYAGKNIYVAFVNQNNDQGGILLDDIAVVFRGDFSLINATETEAVAAKNITISAGVSVNNDIAASDLVATVKAGSYTDTYEAKDVKVEKGGNYLFSFAKPMPLEIGVNNEFTVTVEFAGITQTFEGKVANYAFEVNKRVLLEEGTGTWCGNCPLGEVAIEYIEKTLPDNVAVISVHNDDHLKFDEYDQYLALGGYPKGRINRSAVALAPMVSKEESTVEGDYGLQSVTGDQTFLDAILLELQYGTEAEIKIGEATYYEEEGIVRVPTDVRFALDQQKKTYYIFTCIVEDKLAGRQTNYFSGIESNTLSWWTAQEGKVEWEYNNVARSIQGSFMGVDKRVPRNVTAGETYSSAGDLYLGLTKNPENIHFVVALIDAATGRVVNSDVSYNFVTTDEPWAPLDSVETVEAAVKHDLKVVGGTVYVDGSANVEVYSLAGARLRNENLNRGIYVVRAGNFVAKVAL